MAPPTKVFPETTKEYYQDSEHQVNLKSPVKQITQYECDLSQKRVVTCIPIERFFRIARGGGVVEIGSNELAMLKHVHQ